VIRRFLSRLEVARLSRRQWLAIGITTVVALVVIGAGTAVALVLLRRPRVYKMVVGVDTECVYFHDVGDLRSPYCGDRAAFPRDVAVGDCFSFTIALEGAEASEVRKELHC